MTNPFNYNAFCLTEPAVWTVMRQPVIVEQILSMIENPSRPKPNHLHQHAFLRVCKSWLSLLRNKVTTVLAIVQTVSTLQWAIGFGYTPTYETTKVAAMTGNLDVLTFLYNTECPWDTDTLNFAAQEGHIDCLRFALENGCIGSEWTCSYAARTGHLDCLKLLYHYNYGWSNGWAKIFAAQCNKMECLKFMHQHETMSQMDQPGETASQAALHGNLECLQYLMEERGCTISSWMCLEVFRRQQKACVQYLYDKGYNLLQSYLTMTEEEQAAYVTMVQDR